MNQKLCRNEEEKMLAGVCSGLADYFLIDVSRVRIAFLLTLLVAGGLSLLGYVAMWIVIPQKSFVGIYADDLVAKKKSNYESRNVYFLLGLFLVTVGSFYLLRSLNIIPVWLHLADFWPSVLVLVGVLSILQSNKKGFFFLFGLFLVIAGSLFLLRKLDIIPGWFNFAEFLYSVLILAGILLISRSVKKETESLG